MKVKRAVYLLILISLAFAFSASGEANAKIKDMHNGAGLSSGGSCASGLKSGITSHNGVVYGDTCTGLAWRYYRLDDEGIKELEAMGAKVVNKNKIIMPSLLGNSTIAAIENAENVPGLRARGATITGCKDAKGFYHLGYERYSGGQFENKQFGTVSAKVVSPPLGKGDWGFHVTGIRKGKEGKDGLEDIRSWNNVKKNFRKARNQSQNGTDLGFMDTGWFCFDEDEPDPDPTLPCDPNGDPDENEECQPSETEGSFYATTTIDIPAQNNDVNAYHKETGRNQSAMVALSTKGDSLEVTFKHTLGYSDELWKKQRANPEYPRPGRDTDNTFDKICAKLTAIKNTRDIEPKKKPFVREEITSSEDFCTGGNANKNNTIYQENKYKIENLKPGETRQVCQRLKIKKYNWEVNETINMDWTDPTSRYSYDCNCDSEGKNCGTCYDYSRKNLERKTWDATETSGGKKLVTEACVLVNRPTTPGPSDEPGSEDSGLNIIGQQSIEPLYVGEDTSAIWSLGAPHYPTYQIEKYQHVTYGTPADRTDWQEIVKAKPNQGPPCATTPGNCDVIVEEDVNPGTGSTFDLLDYIAEEKLAVPDGALGDKYCITSGVNYQYYLGEANSITISDLAYSPLGRFDWHTVKSSCKPLAKKPSVAIWNGSLYTGGGIDTLTADRFESPGWGKKVSDPANGQRKLFGSWSEHIAAVGKINSGLGSGASLAIGSEFNADTNFSKNFPLTIANQDPDSLGNSGVKVSTAIDQLKARMVNGDTPTIGSSFNPPTSLDAGQTYVYKANSDFAIDSDITNAGGGYTSISQIPQIFIFLEGDHEIKISKDVRKIDAWIIAPNGTIDTCVNFQNGSTEAKGDCNQRLIFNGPVVAKNIKLNRSHGSEGGNNANRALPAEVFNYRADAYLWAYAQSGKFGTSLNEVYMSELAPRY